ncbi:MAG: hypothetical protein AB7S69_07095 [Salinivirgaceae bacterium]
MLKTGIVGHQNSQFYYKNFSSQASFKVVGIFDPSFQFETPSTFPKNLIFSSFGELLNQSDVLIFASAENTYYPLIELAVKQGKPVFLHSTYYLSLDELSHLIKLKEEASGLVEVYHPYLWHDAFIEYGKLSKTPLLVESSESGIERKDLIPSVRNQVNAILTRYSSNVKRVTANIISSFSEVPDIITLRLDFNNGSIVNIMVNSIEKEMRHTVKFFEYNSYYAIDLTQNQLVCSDSANDFKTLLSKKNNTADSMLQKQSYDFYHNIMHHLLPQNSLENEYNTCKVMEKVKEKMRVSINIF